MKNYLVENYNQILDEAKAICTTYPEKSFAMCKEVYDIARTCQLQLEEAYAAIGMSLAYRAKSETSSMLEYSFNALEIFEKLQIPIGQARALNIIGIAYFYNSMYEAALKYLLRAVDLFDQFTDNSLLSSILNNIGEVFRESGKYDLALEYYHKALKISKDIDAKINIASLLNNIGQVYFIKNSYNEAFEYFMQSYNLLIEEKEMIILGEVENKLGNIYYIKNNYSKAEEYFFSSLKRLENVDNKFYAVDVLVNLARLSLKKDSNQYTYYLEKAIQYAEKANAKKKLSEVYNILSDYYEKNRDFKYALDYFKKYHGIEHEITTSSVGNKLEILKIELNHLRESHKFEQLKMINERLETEISIHRNELNRIQELNKVLEKKALEDELTGVSNRSFIKYQLNKNWEEVSLHNHTIALFMIDIDNFKKYNDYWGHLKGDECLKKIASCLKVIQEKRGDVFARYGGEEFIYYATNINCSQAIELGNFIRDEVEKLCLKYTIDENSSSVTISVGGVFGKPTKWSTIPEMIQLADNELYKAKNMGRNITSVNSLIE
jgi:diguanylate cyclase (GGDEF)-like protein